MSITVTENRTTTTLLADYELYHSGHQEAISTPPAAPLTVSSAQPPSWPTHHRRVPPYRPINYNIDFEDRPYGSNPIEGVFICVMMHGVWLNASVAKLWRHTGGRLNDRIFRYKVGGEW